MDGENRSKAVSTPTPILEPSRSPPLQRPPPPIPLSVRRPSCPLHHGHRVPRAVGVDAKEVDEVDLSDVPAPSRGKQRTSWV